MQKTIKKALAFLMAFAVAVSIVTTGSLTSMAASTPTVTYKVHAQTYGWAQGWKSNSATAGYTGQSKRLEAIQIKVSGDSNLGVTYRVHAQDYGWAQGWKSNGATSGYTGQSKRLEAIQIKLTGSSASKYDIYYRVHAQTYGWMGWAKNGESAGTAAQSLRLEAIQIVIVQKGKLPSGGTYGSAYIELGSSVKTNTDKGLVNYSVHVQDYGDQGVVSDGSIAGTSGKSKRLEAIKIHLSTSKLSEMGMSGSGITYRTHVQNKGWMNWVSNNTLSGTSGQSLRLEAIQIKLTGKIANSYDVYYRVHAQDFGWMGWAKNGESAGTANGSKRLEAIQICVVPKGTKPSDTQKNTSASFVSVVTATGLAATIDDAEINVGETAQITTTVSPTNVTSKKVTYTSSDTSIATVDSNGKVTAVGPGTATITAKTADGSAKTADVTVTVVQPVTKIIVLKSSITLENGETANALIKVMPTNASDKTVTYTTSNSAVATVTDVGMITAVGRGTATITVAAKDGSGVQNMIEVNVTESLNITEIKVKNNASATVTFSGVGEKFVTDLDKAVSECKDSLEILEGEDWTATDGNGNTYKVTYANGKLTYYENGVVITSNELQSKISGKGTLTLTAPVQSGKASYVIYAAYQVQKYAKYVDSESALKASIKVNGEEIKLVKAGSQYSQIKLGDVEYSAYFTEDALNIVGNAINNTTVEKLVNENVITATYKEN